MYCSSNHCSIISHNVEDNSLLLVTCATVENAVLGAKFFERVPNSSVLLMHRHKLRHDHPSHRTGVLEDDVLALCSNVKAPDREATDIVQRLITHC